MEMVLLSKEDLQVMLDEAVERAVSSFVAHQKKVAKGTMANPENIDYDAEIENYIPLQKLYETMGISRAKWYRKYQHIFQHKPYGGETFVYKPSVYDFFIKGNINKKNW